LKTTFYAFGNGLREGDDPKMQEPGTPRRIRNLRPVKGGRLAVRRDFAAVAMTSNLAFDLVAQDLCKLGDRLFAIGGRIPGTTTAGPADLYEYVNLATFKWRSTDSQGQQRLCPATGVRDIGALPTQTAACIRIDVAAANGLVCLVAEIGTSGTSVVHIFRASDDATVLIEQVVCSRPRVCAVGGVFFITGVNTTSIILRRFNPASDETLATLTAAFGAGNAITAYDLRAEETGTGFAVALCRNTPTTTIARFNSSGTSVQTITGSTTAADRVAVFSDGTTRVHVATKLSSGNTVILNTYAIAGGALQSGPTTLFSSATTQTQPGIARHSSTQIVVTMGSTALSILSDIRAEAGHANGGSQTWLGMVMQSKPQRYADGNLVLASHTQTVGVLTRSNQLLAYSQELLAICKDKDVGVDLDQEHMPQVAFDSSTGRYYWPNSVRETAEAGARPVVTELKLMSTDRRQTAELGSDLYIAGGTVQRCDGRQVVECAFQETPEILTASSSADSGSVSPGTLVAATLTTQPVTPPAGSLNGLSFLISVDSGAYQTVTFGAGDTTATAIAATIDAATTGITATVVGTTVRITSNTTGPASKLLVFDTLGTAVFPILGFVNGQVALGSSTPAIYQLAACWEWRDSEGKLERSKPSPVVEVTMGGPTHNQIDVTATLPASSRRNASNDEYGQAVRLVIFCSTDTQVNGGDFTLFRDVESLVSAGFSVAASATLHIINNDETREEAEVLYTQGQRGALSGPLPFDAPLPAEYIEASADALLTGGLPHREQVQESRPLFPGEPSTWTNQIGAFKALTGDVKGVIRLDERRIAFTSTELREMRGDGLDDNGFGDLGKPAKLSSDDGLLTWQSLVEYRGGVMFQGRPTKIYRIARGGGSPEWVGRNVEDTLAAYPNVSAAVYLQDDQTVCFACNNNAGNEAVILVYDCELNQWYVDGPFNSAITAMAEYQGRLAIIRGGVVQLQSASQTPAAFISREWNGATVHPFDPGEQGWVDRIYFFGTYRGNSKLTCTVSFDDGKTSEAFVVNIDGAALGLTVGQTYRAGFHCERKECDRVRVDFLEEFLDVAASEGLEWHFWGISDESEGIPSLLDPLEQH